MIHPDTELRYINDAIGYGVFATAFIPKGTIVYIKDSLEIEIDPQKYYTLDAQAKEMVDKYSYRDENGVRIVSWDFAKYVNHCCQCNTISTGYGFEVAVKDIHAGEQITDEYGIFNLEKAFEVKCDKAECRCTLSPNDFDNYYPEWDKKIVAALEHFALVTQPLAQLIDEKTRIILDEYLRTKENYRSVYTLRFFEQQLNGKHYAHQQKTIKP